MDYQMKSKITNDNQAVNLATLTTMIALTLLLVGCSSSLSNNGSGERLALLPADDIELATVIVMDQLCEEETNGSIEINWGHLSYG